MGLSIGISWFYFLLVIGSGIFAIWYFYRYRQAGEPILLFSRLDDLQIESPGLRVRYQGVGRFLLIFSAVFFGLALIDPHLLQPKKDDGDFSGIEQQQGEDDDSKEVEEVELPSEGIGIYLVLDRSGSMGQEILLTTSRGQRKMSRFDFMKQVTSYFVKGNEELGLSGRRQDMMGLIGFARVAQVEAPLTLDHRALLERLATLERVQRQEEDGTAIGYAVFKTTHLIKATRHYSQELVQEGKPAYEIKSYAIVLVTDGLPTSHPLDQGHALRNIELKKAAEEAKGEGIRLYIVNIEPQIMRPEFTLERKSLKASAELTGGLFFVASEPASLPEIYREIDQLEKSELPNKRTMQAEIDETVVSGDDESQFDRTDFYPFLIGCGLVSLFLSVLLDTTWLRRVP